MNSAKKLLQFDFNSDAFARRAQQTSKPSQQNLNILKKIVEKHGNADYELPDREDLHQVYHRFIRWSQADKLHQEFSISKRIRQLTWVLTFSEENHARIVDSPSQLHKALQLIEEHFRISHLPGIFNALLETWGTPNAKILRTFIKRHLTDYNGKRKFAQQLKTNMAWYCEENSATQLAMELFRSNRTLTDVWSFLELPEYMNIYPYFGAVAEAFVSLISHLDREVFADVVNFLEKHNNADTSRSILSDVIQKLGLDASEHVRAPVQSYVLREWQDPRIVGAELKWRGVSHAARKIFIKWLTEADLGFFFDIVAKACNDQKFAYRKAFWLSYLEHITYCRPVLRRNAEYILTDDPQAWQYYRDRNPATLKGASNADAFIIQMGNYTFVEFSTAGACYCYQNSNLPLELADSVFTMNTLKNRGWATHRVIHSHTITYSWQKRFESWIYNKLGIRPLRSYKIKR